MARTGEEILNAFYQQAIADGLISAKFEQGRLGLLFSVIAKEFVLFEQFLERYIAEMNLSTAQNASSIELLALPFHLRQRATVATVTLRFTKDDTITDDYVIPFGTLVQTSDLNPIVYRTIEQKTLYIENDYVDIIAYSVDAGSSNIVKEDTLKVLTKRTPGIYVTNPKDAYGGVDQESLSSLRTSALNFRFQLEKGTLVGLQEVLKDYGLSGWQYNIVENEFGMGSLAVYVDTENDAIVDDVKRLMTINKAEGVYLTCKKVIPVPIEFNFDITISSEKKLLPEERDRLKTEIAEIFQDFVNMVGVGKKLVKSRAITYMFSRLINEWFISDIDVTFEGSTENINDRGNITVESWEVVKIQELNISIDTE